MYRMSDIDCDEPDEAPFPQKSQKYIEGKDCLSKGATYQLLKQIRPRLVMTGHSHHGCTRPLMNDEGVEITLPSFSWRNKDNPSYGLVGLCFVAALPLNLVAFRLSLLRTITLFPNA